MKRDAFTQHIEQLQEALRLAIPPELRRFLFVASSPRRKIGRQGPGRACEADQRGPRTEITPDSLQRLVGRRQPLQPPSRIANESSRSCNRCQSRSFARLEFDRTTKRNRNGQNV